MIKHLRLTLYIFTLLAFAGCETTGEFVKPADIHWEYEHPDWQNEGFGDCGGKVQSPINFDTSRTIKAQLSDVITSYQPFKMKIVDNGHTLQVNTPNNLKIQLNGTEFTLKQFHFHRHSEHHINGNASEMELHLVHVDEVTGNITVLGILLEKGAENALIEQVLNNVPVNKKEEVVTAVELNLRDILPGGLDYYTYTGSLTTPPCSQGLQWIVFKEKMTVSDEQIKAFEGFYHDNARPIQPVNNRPVLEKI